MANRTTYSIVARYMTGREVNGYRVVSSNSGNEIRLTREQVIFLVGKGCVVNCKGQIYKGEVLLNGVGINLSDLPVIQEEAPAGKSNTSSAAVNREQPMATLVKRLIKGTDAKNAVGYEVKMPNGTLKKLSRADVCKLALEKKISNARAQEYQGRMILRGYNCDLNDLPTEVM